MNFKRNVFFICSIILVILILTSHIIMQNPSIRSLINAFLPKSESMASAYFQVIGTLVGTCFAVGGAMWTQNLINAENAKQDTSKCAKLVYFDAIRGIDFVRKLYIKKELYTTDIIEFKKVTFNVTISSHWGDNIIAISEKLSDQDIEKLYFLFQYLQTLNDCIDKALNNSNEMAKTSLNVNDGELLTNYENKTYIKYLLKINDLLDFMKDSFLSKDIDIQLQYDIKQIDEKKELWDLASNLLREYTDETFPDIHDIKKQDKKYQELESAQGRARNGYIDYNTSIKEKWETIALSKLDTEKDVTKEYLDLFIRLRKLC